MTLSMQITINGSALTPSVYRLECESFCMDEGISVPFRLEAVFISENDYTSANVVGQTAWFYISQNNIGRCVGGVVLEFRVLNKTDINSYTYSVVLGPRISLLDKIKQSEVMATTSQMDLYTVISNCLNTSMNANATISDSSLGGITIEYSIHSSLTAGTFLRNNITKYNESDLSFFQRTCEKYGVFYFFDYLVNSLGNDQVNVTDSVLVACDNAAFLQASPSTWTFKAPTTTVGASTDNSVENAANLGAVVFSLEYVARPIIQQFNLRNYSPTTPFSVMGTATQETGGIGGVVEYGEYFASSSDAQTVAAYRAQENAWQSSLFECRSTIASLATGQVFTLSEHPISSYNTQYVVVSARHEAGRRGPLGYSANYPTTPYANSFTAIEASLPFRPRRVTPKPVMSGVYNAFVQASESTPGTPQTRSVMDQYGQYNVGFVYNEAQTNNPQAQTNGQSSAAPYNSVPGQGSAPIRQVQPYANSGAGGIASGMQFPLVSNTEVLVGYINGDPDQPIIMGAAFNQVQTDVVNSNSDTVNRVVTTGGLLLEMNDGAASSSPPSPRYVRFDVPFNVTDGPPGAGTSNTATGHYFRMGDPPTTADSTAGSGLTTYNNGTATATTPADGILMFSQSTIDLCAQGAGLMSFATGHTVQVAANDSCLNVQSGMHTTNATKGINLNAGSDASHPTGDIILNGMHYTNNIAGNQNVSTSAETTWYSWGSAFKFNGDLALTINLELEQTVNVGVASTVTFLLYTSIIFGMYFAYVTGAKVDVVTGTAVKFVGSEVKMSANESTLGVMSDKIFVYKGRTIANYITTAGVAVANALTRSRQSGVEVNDGGAVVNNAGSNIEDVELKVIT